MKIGPAGLELIKQKEGYHKRLKNGDCTTYYCPAGVLTIGYGCTVGIRPGEIWTHQQAIERLMEEIAKHEDAVNRLVTAPINQNQFDALVSLSYNVGSGGLARSSVLSLTNQRQYAAAARGFALWNKATDPRTKRLVVLPGLTTRRAAEAALYLTPTQEADDPDMPQVVAEPADRPQGSRKDKAAAAGQVAAGGGVVGLAGLSAAESVGYAQQAAQFIREYGVELALAFCVIGGLTFAAYRYFTRQDYEEGRYVPREAAE